MIGHKAGDKTCIECRAGYPVVCGKCDGLVHATTGDIFLAQCDKCGGDFGPKREERERRPHSRLD